MRKYFQKFGFGCLGFIACFSAADTFLSTIHATTDQNLFSKADSTNLQIIDANAAKVLEATKGKKGKQLSEKTKQEEGFLHIVVAQAAPTPQKTAPTKPIPKQEPYIARYIAASDQQLDAILKPYIERKAIHRIDSSDKGVDLAHIWVDKSWWTTTDIQKRQELCRVLYVVLLRQKKEPCPSPDVRFIRFHATGKGETSECKILEGGSSVFLKDYPQETPPPATPQTAPIQATPFPPPTPAQPVEAPQVKTQTTPHAQVQAVTPPVPAATASPVNSSQTSSNGVASQAAAEYARTHPASRAEYIDRITENIKRQMVATKAWNDAQERWQNNNRNGAYYKQAMNEAAKMKAAFAAHLEIVCPDHNIQHIDAVFKSASKDMVQAITHLERGNQLFFQYASTGSSSARSQALVEQKQFVGLSNWATNALLMAENQLSEYR